MSNSLRAIRALVIVATFGSGLDALPLPAQDARFRSPPGPGQFERDFDPDMAIATFDSVWTRIQRTHYDPEMGGLDWEAVRAETRPRVPSAASTVELRRILGEMLARLGDSHFSIIPGPDAAIFGALESSAPSGDGDPGIEVRWLDGAAVVTRIRPGSPAEQSGVRAGWIIERIDETAVQSLVLSIRDAAPLGLEERHLVGWLPGAVRSRLLGAVGTSVEVTFGDGDGRPRRLAILRDAPSGERVTFGNLPPLRVHAEHFVERVGSGFRVGVIRLSAWFPAIVSRIATAVDELRDADAIVLDLRGNPGGLGGLVMGVGGHFVDEPLSLGTMRTRDTTLRFVINPQRVAPDGRRVDPYGGPLVILVDPLTGSTSEIFAGGMQALGRATVVGETTSGQALPALVSALPNGDRLLHAVADFTAPDGSRLEGRGVRPDVALPLSRAGLLREDDPVLRAALDRISSELGAVRE